ncbi:hypothetical protein ACLOJK_013119 [Asimina triloba]
MPPAANAQVSRPRERNAITRESSTKPSQRLWLPMKAGSVKTHQLVSFEHKSRSIGAGQKGKLRGVEENKKAAEVAEEMYLASARGRGEKRKEERLACTV